jgi:hypothetical protein
MAGTWNHLNSEILCSLLDKIRRIWILINYFLDGYLCACSILMSFIISESSWQTCHLLWRFKGHIWQSLSDLWSTTQCYLFALGTIVIYSVMTIQRTYMTKQTNQLMPSLSRLPSSHNIGVWKFQNESYGFIQQFLNKIKIKQHDTCSYTPKRMPSLQNFNPEPHLLHFFFWTFKLLMLNKIEYNRVESLKPATFEGWSTRSL